MYITRLTKRISANPEKIIFQYFNPGNETRIKNIINKILSLSESEAEIFDADLYGELPVGRVLREILRRPRLRTVWGILVAAGVQRDYRASERFTW